jgi:hypothetical protein
MLRLCWLSPQNISPLAGRSDSFVKNSGNYIELLKPVDLQKNPKIGRWTKSRKPEAVTVYDVRL